MAANCRCSYPRAAKYMQIAKYATKGIDPETFDGGLDAFLEAHATKRTQEPAPAAQPPAPSFTREDAECALKIHARVERWQDGERDVAATKLAKVAEGFGMDAEARIAEGNHG